MHYRRLYVPGGTYFFTLTLANRKQTLLIDHIHKLKWSFKTVKDKHPFTLNAIVILPDHLHMLMTLPNADIRYSNRIGLIKSYFSKKLIIDEEVSRSRKQKRERGIWQRRFWEHHIRDERDYEFHVNYIHYNPVKHGYVSNPIDWKYSSFHLYIKNKILSEKWSAEVAGMK